MGLAVLGVIVLGLIVLAYLASRSWLAWHTIFLFLVAALSLVFMIFAAATLKTQKRWRSQYEQAMTDMTTEEDRHEKLVRGVAGDEEPGLVALRAEVGRVSTARGRVWRNLRFATAQGDKLVLDATGWGDAGCLAAGSAASAEASEEDAEPAAEDAPAPAGGAAAPAAAAVPATALGLQENAVVYAFKEAPLRALPEALQTLLLDKSDLAAKDAQGRCKIPVYYLGEFKVVGDPNANPAALTLTNAMPLTDAQMQQLQEPNSTWVLYEIMPVDSHVAFEGLTAEQLTQLFTSDQVDPAVVQAVAAELTRDQQPANENDPPERKWMRIEFTQPHTQDVDVDAAGEQLADVVFDPSGRSMVPTLNQGGPTQFQPNDQVDLDFATAQELISAGKAKAVQPVYRRRLHDYAREFRAYTADLASLSRQIETAEADLAKIDQSLKDLQSQLAFQETQRADLEFDQKGLQHELEVLNHYHAALESKWNELRTELSRLFRMNKQLVGVR